MCFSSGVYLYFRILIYVKRHEQFEIGCGAILNKIYYYYYYYKQRRTKVEIQKSTVRQINLIYHPHFKIGGEVSLV